MNIYQFEMQFYLLILDVLNFAFNSYFWLREWSNQHKREVMMMILLGCVAFVYYCIYMEEDLHELERIKMKLNACIGRENIPIVELLNYKLVLFISKALRAVFPFV